jgi:hypothetical protein
MKKTASTSEKAKSRLLGLWRKSRKSRQVGRSEKKSGSWREVSAGLGGQFSAAMLSQVAAGKRRASSALLDALGLREKNCAACGRRLPNKKPRIEYDEWKQKAASKIAALLEWAMLF